MRKKEVRILPVGEDDLAEILDYISLDKPSAAVALANRFEKTILALQKNPYIGRSAKEKELKKLGYRYLVIGNYLLFYVVGVDIVIHRILHGARDYLRIIS